MKPVCAVVGVGPGNGAALARRFAREGYRVALLARSRKTSDGLAKELGDARAYECDVADEVSVKAVFAAIRKDLGEIDVAVLNAGSGTRGTIDDLTPQVFEASWRVNAFAPVPCRAGSDPCDEGDGRGQHHRHRRHRVRRGMPRTTAFAPAKVAQKSLAEAMARHLISGHSASTSR